jgi:hypothetical protein
VQLNINLTADGNNRQPVFSLSVDNNRILDREKDTNLQTMDALLSRLQEYLENQPEHVEVTINAHPDVKSGLVRALIARLESEPYRSHIQKTSIGVSEK